MSEDYHESENRGNTQSENLENNRKHLDSAIELHNTQRNKEI